ncbi:energy transducer TonB [Cognatiluteimonas lumbrici]|uniref:energy transducer TonB n=1 Tax=Cognatiluteimonas lumbrici TaxID=2559601 RepID=UPI001125B743|nr:energy transducer TonB [Luteimonas lumbrici]
MKNAWIAVAGLALLAAGANAQQRERVANEGTIGDKWMLEDGTTLATPVYPATQASRGDNVCVALGYRIEPDGSTAHFRVLQQWSSAGSRQTDPAYWEAFARAAADAVAQWRFQPRADAGTPVPTVTVATLTFNGDPTAASADIGGNCRIVNLNDRLAQLGIKRFSDRSITAHGEFHRRQRVGEVMQADAAAHRQRRP